MTSVPTNPLDVPPYQVQPLIASVIDDEVDKDLDRPPGVPTSVEVRCAQALGSGIYVGCTDGRLLRFALQANGPDEPESYALLSTQRLPSGKPVDEIVLVQSISVVFVLCDHQVYFFTLPSLDPLPFKPIRNVQALAVDHDHVLRPPPPLPDTPVEPIEFAIVKRSSITLYSFLDRPFFHKEVPLPGGGFLAKRSGRRVCVADREYYAVVNLDAAVKTPVMPITQVPGGPPVRPHIAVVAPNEFLILSWNGAGTMGLFVTGDADAVRGTLEWPAHPLSVCLDWPYITTLLPNQTIEVHNVDTQQLAQVVAAPPLPVDETTDPAVLLAAERRRLAVSAGGFLVPSRAQSEKLRLRKVRLLGRTAKPDTREVVELPSFEAFGAEGEEAVEAENEGALGADAVEAEDGGAGGADAEGAVEADAEVSAVEDAEEALGADAGGAVQAETEENEDDGPPEEMDIPPPIEGYDTASR